MNSLGTAVAQARLAPSLSAASSMRSLRSLLGPSLALFGLGLLAEGRALGAEPTTPDAPAPARRWYGWQSAMVDAAAVGLSLPLALRDETDELLLFAFVGPPAYAVGAPIVHFAHDNVPKGLASLGLRLGVPPILGGLASLGCDAEGREKCVVSTALVSMFAVMILDDALLAYENVPSPASNGHAALRLHPTLAIDRHGAVAGVGLTL
jgi:hypothetical protein